MRSSWLSKTSTALICALALSSASVSADSKDAVDELHFNNLGQMIWDTDRQQEIVQNAAKTVKQAANDVHSKADLLWAQAKIAAEQVGEHIQSESAHLVDQFDINRALTKDYGKTIKDQIHRLAKGVLRESEIAMNGASYQRLVHPAFPKYALRVSQHTDTTSCDPDVKSYTGYLDIGQDKHLWFAFFESRAKKLKSETPTLLFLNGGPGCASSGNGWLFEGVGPCTVNKNGTAVNYNKNSWTNDAHVFFLDQPVNVGYSYSESGSVNNTPDAADDVYAFLNLFFAKYSEYADSEFSIAGESYGGRYVPLIADKIFSENAARRNEAKLHGMSEPKTINLKSILLGNGLTDPKVQFGKTHEYLCESDHAIFKPDSEVCQGLPAKQKTCLSLIDSCYKYDSRLTCTPAGLYCWSNLFGDAQNSGRNLYDVRKKCDRSPDKDGPLCYRQEAQVEKYLNRPEIKKAYGVPQDIQYEACNMQINQAFLFAGDGMKDSAAVLPALFEQGLRVLVYAGEYDVLCNWIGNVGDESWPLLLESIHQKELNAAKKVDWKVDGHLAGYVRKAGKGAGDLILLKLNNAGHMTPLDQPRNSAAMIKTWLNNEKFE